jgi:sulfhydrogenase subunit gamma (sulfur reductase)
MNYQSKEEDMVANPIEKSLYLPRLAKMTKKERFTDKEMFFEFRFDDNSNLNHRPGQFVELSIYGIGEAPISISSSPTQQGYFELCVRAVGRVTNYLHNNMDVGSYVGIRGPFGNGFPYEKFKGHDILFICGGLGVAPLRSLINYTLDKTKRGDFGKIYILYGCKNNQEWLYKKEVEEWQNRADVETLLTVDKCTDPNWKGNVGVITTLIPKVNFDVNKTIAVICGPPVMYKFVVLELKNRNFKEENIYMSLERKMKCGVGKCGHCQINNVYVCQSGPVFDLPTVRKLQEAI